MVGMVLQRAFLERPLDADCGEPAFRIKRRATVFVGERCVAQRAREQAEQRRTDERKNDKCRQHFQQRESTLIRSHSRIATLPVNQSTSTSYLRSPAARVMRPPFEPPSGKKRMEPTLSFNRSRCAV